MPCTAICLFLKKADEETTHNGKDPTNVGLHEMLESSGFFEKLFAQFM